MSLAIAILADKNAGQVARLFHAVYRPEHAMVLHFDRRAPRSLHDLGAKLVANYSNVVVLRSRRILPNDHETAAVQIEAMAAALRMNASWHHYMHLSGQDFPIKSVDEFEASLLGQPQANYVSWFDPIFTPLWSNARERLDRYYLHWPWLHDLLRIPGIGRKIRAGLRLDERIPHVPFRRRQWPDFRYYAGSNHVVLSRAGCAYVALDDKAHRITRWLKNSAHANEIVFPTVMLNGPLASTVVNTHFHEVVFSPNCPTPRCFGIEDLDRLTTSSKFFAHKFDESADPAVLDRLSERCKMAVSSQLCAPTHS